MATLRGLGSASIGRSVLAALAREDVRHQFQCWIPREWSERWVPPEMRNTVRRIAAGGLAKLVAENVEIRRALGGKGADRLFSLGDTSLPRCRIPHLLMVQQAFLAYDPAEWDFEIPATLRAKFWLMGAYFRSGIPTVTAFAVQTQDMRDRLAARWKIPQERIRVVPSAIDESWGEVAHQPPAFAKDPPYICYVAGPGSHKNHAILADVMRALPPRHRDLRCVLTVSAQSVADLVSRAHERGVLHRFEFRGSLRFSELRDLLTGAVAMVMPSKLESFGLPYYEALAAGCPVVAADRAFAREALGDVGRYATADDAEVYAGHVASLVGSATHRVETGLRGKARWLSTRKTWQEITAEYLRILEEL